MVFGKGIAKGLMTVVKHVRRTPVTVQFPEEEAGDSGSGADQPGLVRRALHGLFDLRAELSGRLHPGGYGAARGRVVPG